MLTESVREKIESVLSQHLRLFPEVCAAFLYGSHANFTARPDSDIDIGIIVEAAGVDRLLEIHQKLAADLPDKGEIGFVDGSDIFFAREVVKHYVLLYCRDDFDAASYFSRTLRQYEDFKPYLFVQKQALKKSLIEKDR
jgi:uncharacterized protein